MKLVQMPVTDFVNVTASDAPAPGGGSVAALEGSLGAALAAMVCALTHGKKKYVAYEEEVSAAESRLLALKDRLLAIIDEDTEAFNAVSAVFSMPKSTEEEKLARQNAMEDALKGCTKPPFVVMETIADALHLTAGLIGKTNASAASDIGCAVLSMKAGIQGAWLNVLINISGLKDDVFASEYRAKGLALLDDALPLADRLYNEILSSL